MVWNFSGKSASVRMGHQQTMKVERRDGESVDQLIRRFNKGVVSERITKIYRDKMHFISKSEQRKEKRRRAERNRRKKMSRVP
jgi:small subunit ribosomal protein S21